MVEFRLQSLIQSRYILPIIFCAVILDLVYSEAIKMLDSDNQIAFYLILGLLNGAILLAYGFWFYILIKPEVNHEGESLGSIVTYYSLISGLVIILVFTLAVIGYFKFCDEIICCFKYFEPSTDWFQMITSQIPSALGLPTVLAVFIAFFAILHIIKKNGAMIYDIDEQKEAIYYFSIESFFGLFNFLIFIPLVLYLLFAKHAFFESSLLIGLLLLSQLIFIPILKVSSQVIGNYNSLSKLDPKGIDGEIRTWHSNTQNRIKSLKPKNIQLEKYRGKKSQKSKLRCYLSRRPNLRGNFDHYIDILSDKVLLKYILLLLIVNKNYILKGLISLTVLIPLGCAYFDFNGLSIVYVVLTLMIWYFIVSVVSLLPRRKVNITLSTGHDLENVYILENSRKGHLIALDPNNKRKTIMKSSIITIEGVDK